MKSHQSLKIAVALALLSLTVFWYSARSASVPTEAELNKIKLAVPDVCRVGPSQARRVLVFSRAWGYKHSSIPYGTAAFEIMALKTGAFEVVSTEDTLLFEREALEEFDAVIFNNTNNEIFLPENLDELSAEERQAALSRDARLKENLVAFLSSGKGLVVIHAGIASFRKWAEFGQIMGARFDNHPWNAGSTVTLKVEEPGHDLCCSFHVNRFEITDEIYQFKGNYSRRNLRVLLSLDTDRTKMNKGRALHRKDNDYALSWIKPYGKGRVFYSALGHQHDIFWNPMILQFYLDGVQFAVGDLKADLGPSEP